MSRRTRAERMRVAARHEMKANISGIDTDRPLRFDAWKAYIRYCERTLAIWDQQDRQQVDRILYGDPTYKGPGGILR